MPNPHARKMKLLAVMRILERDTDTDHFLSAGQIEQKLKASDIPAERKGIYDDIKVLNAFYQSSKRRKDAKCPTVEKEENGMGYYLDNRTFEPADLKLMIDAIKSSKFLSEAKTEELVEGLRTLCSNHQAKNLRRDVIVPNRVKNMNTNIHKNVEFIATAIGECVQMKFRYFDYDVKQQRVFRKKGGFYTVSPYNLIYSDDNYYLLAYDAEQEDFRTFRVDRMANCGLTSAPRDGEEAMKGLKLENYQKYTFNMYGGEIKTVTLRCRNNMMNTIIDKFGRQDYAYAVDKDHFEVSVAVAVSPQFYGWVFGLKNYITITSPPDVVDGMKKHLKAVLKRYE